VSTGQIEISFLSISHLGTFPLVAAEAKKQALVGALGLLIASLGKSIILDASQTYYRNSK